MRLAAEACDGLFALFIAGLATCHRDNMWQLTAVHLGCLVENSNLLLLVMAILGNISKLTFQVAARPAGIVPDGGTPPPP